MSNSREPCDPEHSYRAGTLGSRSSCRPRPRLIALGRVKPFIVRREKTREGVQLYREANPSLGVRSFYGTKNTDPEKASIGWESISRTTDLSRRPGSTNWDVWMMTPLCLRWLVNTRKSSSFVKRIHLSSRANRKISSSGAPPSPSPWTVRTEIPRRRRPRTTVRLMCSSAKSSISAHPSPDGPAIERLRTSPRGPESPPGSLRAGRDSRLGPSGHPERSTPGTRPRSPPAPALDGHTRRRYH